MTTVLKGESASVSVRFRTGIIFPEAPEWTLFDWDDKPLQVGTATQSGDGWVAEFTIPSNLPVPDGVQSVQLEFRVTDNKGRDHTLTQEIQIVDAFDDARPYGLLWWSGHTSLSDTIILDRQPTEIKVTLQDGGTAAGVNNIVLATQTITSPVPIANTERGLVFELNLTGLAMLKASSGTGGDIPYQLVIEAFYASGSPDVVIKPVYGMSPLIASHVNSLKRYLDKGQFTDIDPNLQWSDEEMVHFLFEGMAYVNAFPPEVTYWGVESSPRPLHAVIQMSAAWIALNARYIAEGFSKFNFSSGAVNLDWDRTGPIEMKMNELKGALDMMLDRTKKAVVATAGNGGGPSRSVGSLGISLGPMTNNGIRYGGYFRRG